MRYIESETGWINRVLGKDFGGKQNLLVMNDEAHHAYRIGNTESEDGDEEDEEHEAKEATVWIDGLDRIHRARGINFCLDLSATPFFLSRVGQQTNRPLGWLATSAWSRPLNPA